MHVESVAWISGRKDVLNSFFLLSGLISWLFFIKERRFKYFWLLFSFVLFILACLSKATAVVFPVILILINYLFTDEENINHGKALLKAISPRNILPLLPFFAVSVFFGLMAVQLQSGENFLGMMKFIKDPHDVVNIVAPFSGLQRIQIAAYGFFVYLVKFVIPANQAAFHPYPELSEINGENFSLLLWLALIAFFILFCLVIFSMKKTRLFMFCFGFYLVTLALVLQFVSVGNAIFAERYTYLPYIGLAIIPAYFISESQGRIKQILLIISALFILIMLILARNQVKVWNSTESLWTQVIERYPDLEMARGARGKYYYMLSAHSENEKDKRALEEKAMTDFRVAIRDYESALTFSPDMALEILRNRSVLYIETDRYENAIKDLDELIKIDGKEFTHYYNRAFSKLMLKDIEGAIEDYKSVLRLNPGDKETLEHLRVLTETLKN